jgi:hypothetical protein
MPTIYIANPDVLYRRLGDEIVLINLTTDRMFNLNLTGARLWELLIAGYNLKKIMQSLTIEFNVEETQLDKEISDMISMFEAEDLIRKQITTGSA